MTETWRKGTNHTSKIIVFQEKRNCFCATLDIYLSMWESWGTHESQVLVSLVKPHKAVTLSLVSRCLKEGLSMTETDTSMFKGNLTRATSTTHQGRCDRSVCLWYDETRSVIKSLQKEIIDHCKNFQASILSNVLWREVVIAMTFSFKQKRRDWVLDRPATLTKWNLQLYKGT